MGKKNILLNNLPHITHDSHPIPRLSFLCNITSVNHLFFAQ